MICTSTSAVSAGVVALTASGSSHIGVEVVREVTVTVLAERCGTSSARSHGKSFSVVESSMLAESHAAERSRCGDPSLVPFLVERRRVFLPSLVAYELLIDVLAIFGFELLQYQVLAQSLSSGFLVDAVDLCSDLSELDSDAFQISFGLELINIVHLADPGSVALSEVWVAGVGGSKYLDRN